MLSALDHIALVVTDLEAAVAQYRLLFGCEPNWRGTEDGVTHAWFQLANMALDVVAPTGEGKAGERVRARLAARGEGLWAAAFATPQLERARRTYLRRGVPSTDAHTIRSTHVASTATREWNTSVLSPDATHGPLLLLIEEKADAAPWPRSGLEVDRAAAIVGLDHIVISTAQPERAAAFYGARLGLELTLDRTNADWGMRLMFFRCGDLIVELAHTLKQGASDAPDALWGLSWRAHDVVATRARLAAARFDVSEVRQGRKPGTRVFTVRDRTAGVPTLVIGQ